MYTNVYSCNPEQWIFMQFPYIASNFLVVKRTDSGFWLGFPHVRDIGASFPIPNLQHITGEAETKTESYIDYIN